MKAGDTTQYLHYAAGDPILALHLQQQDYAQQVESFKSRLATSFGIEHSTIQLEPGPCPDD